MGELKFVKKSLKPNLQKGFVLLKTTGFTGINSMGGVFSKWNFLSLDITKFEVYDVYFLKTIKQQMSNCVLLGYRGYLCQSIQLDIFQTVYIKLETPLRKNQKDYKPQPYIFRKSRKKIETLFTQLCDQFRIINNYAKTFECFITRI